MDLATLFVRFKADTTGAEKSIKGLETNTTKSAGNIAKTLAGAFSAAIIGKGIKDSVDAASNLNETVSKTKVIFGDASTAIEHQGDVAASSMGLSKQAYLDAASGLKGLLDNLGLTSQASTQWSQDLVALGSDLGSFFNKDPADAIAAIQSALRGESEPIRAFNVNLTEAGIKAQAMKDGLYDGVGAIDASARAQAAMKLIMDQTVTSQGDFVRTADGLANSQRTAKADAEDAAASFGQVLLPAYTQVVQVVGAVVKVFGDLPGPVQTAVVALVGLVALAGPIGSMIEVVGSIKTALGGLSASTGGLLLIGAALAGLVLVMSQSDDPHAAIAARSKEVAGYLEKETTKIAEQRQETGQAVTAAQGYADAQLAMSRAITGSDEKGQKLGKALGALGLQTRDAAEFTQLLQVRSGDLIGSQETLADVVKRGGDEASQAETKHRDLAVAMLEQKGVAHDVALVLVEAGQSATYSGDAADITKDKTKGWTDENKALFASIVEVGKQAGQVDFGLAATGALNAAVATNAYNASLVAQAEDQVGASRNSQQAGDVLAAYQTIVDNLTPAQEKLREATGDAGDAAIDASTAINDLGLQTEALATSSDAAADAVGRAAVVADQMKANAEASATATSKLSDSLGDTATDADKARHAADQLRKAWDQLTGGAIGLEDANRAVAAGFDDLTAAAKAAQDAGKAGADTLDINTEAGRKNRETIEQQVKAIEDQQAANIANGASVVDATSATTGYRDRLIDTITQLTGSKEAAEAFVNQLGLTPENISTTVQLQHDDEVKERLQGLLGQLGDIDAGAAAEIQALVDQGKFDEAEAKLEALARDRRLNLVVNVTGGGEIRLSSGAGGRVIVQSDRGRFVRAGSNLLSSLAEPGAGDEVVLPLDNPARMRELAGRNDVGSRILDALAGSGQADDIGGTAATFATPAKGGHSYSLVVNNNRDDLTVDDMAQLIARTRLQAV